MKTILCVFLMFLLFPFNAFAVIGGGDVTFKPAGIDPVIFSHDYHMKNRGIKCSACHFRTFAAAEGAYLIKKEKLNKRDFCLHCHNGLKGFDVTSTGNCVRCHKK
jgi:c(7)-type cytochrome triheme protein